VVEEKERLGAGGPSEHKGTLLVAGDLAAVELGSVKTDPLLRSSLTRGAGLSGMCAREESRRVPRTG
jgi:hypothetical protein